MMLDWHEASASFLDDEEETYLDKSIEIPADPNSFFIAGVILVQETNTDTIKQVDAYLEVRWRQFKTKEIVVTTRRQLWQLFDGSSMEVNLTVSWQYDGRKTQRHRYCVQVESFEKIKFDEIWGR